MPYFAWKGVSLDARLHKGKLFCISKEALDERLLAQGIALISCGVVRQWYLLPVPARHTMLFLQQLQTLLTAGLHVHAALSLLCQQALDIRLADCIACIADDVRAGHALHDAMAAYPKLFDDEMRHVLAIGEHAGNVPVALAAYSAHMEQKQLFAKRMRSALMVPAVTFVFFIVLFLLVLFVIVPRYAQLFATMGKEVPDATRMLLLMHKGMTSLYAFGWLLLVALFIAIGLFALQQERVGLYLDSWLLRLPGIGSFMQTVVQVQFYRSLSLLVAGGMPLVPALRIAVQAVRNRMARATLQEMAAKVDAGQSLAAALQSTPLMARAESLALVVVGQESGTLGAMLERIAHMYQQRVEHTLHRYTLIVQPLCMLLLGIAVAALIFAVYMPLFNLADLI